MITGIHAICIIRLDVIIPIKCKKDFFFLKIAFILNLILFGLLDMI